MKLFHYACIITTVFINLALAQTGGSLTPPFGAPSPTYKTLDQVEARTPLVDGATGVSIIPNGTVTISEPGSYYLTGNLNIVGNYDGIRIESSDVTLDLNGFVIKGNATGSAVGGITATGSSTTNLENITVKSGSIRGFVYSISMYHTNDSSIHQVSCTNAAQHSIYLRACSGNRITGSIISNSGGGGIYLDNPISDGDGNSILHCTIKNTASSGISLYYANKNIISSNIVSDFSGSGIFILGALNRIEGNQVSSTVAQHSGINIFEGSHNLIIKNIVSEQFNNYLIFTGNVYGPITSNTGVLSNTGNASHPWANFSLNETP